MSDSETPNKPQEPTIAAAAIVGSAAQTLART